MSFLAFAMPVIGPVEKSADHTERTPVMTHDLRSIPATSTVGRV